MSVNKTVSTKKKCIHKYLNELKTVKIIKPPGLADFLRGTITLFKYSQQYGYDFFIDKNIHPFFSFLEDCQYYVYDDKTQEIVHELLDHLPWPRIDIEINKLFRSGEDFSIITNGFYTKYYNVNNKDLFTISNFGCIPDDCKNFMRTLLRPNDCTKTRLNEYYKNINLNMDLPYIVFHLRFGDNYIFDGFFDLELAELLSDKIKIFLSNQEKQVIIISDSVRMAKLLKENNPTLFYNETDVTHLGNNINNADIEDTVVDFFVLSKASQIYSINDSGFSRLTSLIFDIYYNNTIFSTIHSNSNIELNADNKLKYHI